MINPLPRPPLLIVTDPQKSPWTAEEIVKIVLEAGCRWVMYRDKAATIEIFRQTAAVLVGLCDKFNAKVCINEKIDVAEGLAGSGIHLQSSYDVPSAKSRLCPSALIGVSCHSISEAQKAEKLGADYVTFSPVFETLSKPGYGPLVGLEGLRNASQRLTIPIIALAGINSSNASQCMESGARGIAVMGGVMRSSDPLNEVTALISATT